MIEPKVRLLLRIPASLKAKLAELAVRDHRSLNREIEFLLGQSVASEKRGANRESRSGKIITGEKK
ncbi:MAG: Arc family DNA-binding protein [Candidatus Acidiferrales bacterium]